ncbi:MAG: phage integrase SAM-like domain-containing protein [Janthinobacterium lividum]
MATVNFYLDKADKEGKSPIMMTYQAAGQKFRHSVKVKILASQWLSKKQRLKTNSLDDEFVNNIIKGLEEIITKAERESLLTNQQIDFSYVKRRFNESVKKTGEKKKTFIECFNDYIENSKTQKTLETTKRYQTTLNHLVNFKKAKKYELTFDRINIQFYENFITYLINSKKLLNNSVGNYVKTVKSFMNFAHENGFCQNIQDFKKFKVFKEDGELIYMTEEEVMKLVYLEEGMTDKLRSVRDNFCFACFTGLRYSDISILKPENIKEEVLLIKTEKQGTFYKSL